MGTEREIIERMRAAAPPGQESLGPAAVRQLQDLTQQLITAKGGAGEEYARFQAITQRTLCLPGSLLTGWLRDATVLVTGGTGCIGSTLMTQLAQVPPRRLVSVSRGHTTGPSRLPDAEYLEGDVRDRERIDELIQAVREHCDRG